MQTFGLSGCRRLEEVEIRPLNGPGPLHLALHMHGRRREPNLRAIVLSELRGELAVTGLDPVAAARRNRRESRCGGTRRR